MNTSGAQTMNGGKMRNGGRTRNVETTMMTRDGGQVERKIPKPLSKLFHLCKMNVRAPNLLMDAPIGQAVDL